MESTARNPTSQTFSPSLEMSFLTVLHSVCVGLCSVQTTAASCCHNNPRLSACVWPPTPPPLRATVHVRVNDVNEFSPVFVERRYEASVPEGRLFDRIVRVEALDADCSPQYSQICFYDIITPSVPFAIDNDGTKIFISHF